MKRVHWYTDHKTGCILSKRIMSQIPIPMGFDHKVFFLFLNQEIPESEKCVIIIRHPKDIIISGYLYHKKCSEVWCNTDGGKYYGGYTLKINDGLKDYYNRGNNFSNPKSYKSILKSLPQEEGIIHEMNHVAKHTIDGMYNLMHYKKPNVLILKYEDLVFRHDITLTRLCQFLEIEEKNINSIVNKCRGHNLLSQKENQKLTNHTTNKKVDKDRYKEYWSENIEREFKKLFPKDVLSKFNYE